jgi:hypothetical protein
MTISTLDAILVPVASREDARETAAAVREYLDPAETAVTVVYVVEKAGGAPDKAGVEQREAVAAEAFEAFKAELPKFAVETEVVYDTDVADGIFAAAEAVGADAIAFVPRNEGGRLARFLSGDVALSLVTENDLPVVSLPDVRTDETPDEEDGG